MPVTLKYWDLRGLVDTHVLMLEYLGVDYVMDYVTDREGWLEEKYNLGMDFPNLPVYTDGNVKMSQSLAIMKFIARKYQHGKLYPEGEEDLRRAEAAEGFLIDLRVAWGRLCYNPDFEKLKDGFEREIPGKFRPLEQVLAKREWAASKLSYVDFGIASIMDYYETLFPGCFDGLPQCKKYRENFFGLPEIQKYRTSARFRKFPINGPQAAWGGKIQS